MPDRTSTPVHAALRPRPRFPPRPDRALQKVEYRSALARIHHTLLPLFVYAHAPLTVFLDYNTIFVLTQIASAPETGGDGGDVVSASGTVWWFALALYGLADLGWLVGVVILYEGVFHFARRWSVGQPLILPIYTSPAAFNLSAFRSFSLYSFLYRVRFSASFSDFCVETLWFYSQNWPTIITLVPRAVICTAILIIYHADNNSFSTPAKNRDSAYFDSTTQLLTTYAFVILLINAVWAAWRISLFVGSVSLYWMTNGFGALFHKESLDHRRAGAESALSLRPHTAAMTLRSRSRQSEPTLVAPDSSALNAKDDPQFSPLPPPLCMAGDRSSQTGTPILRSSHEVLGGGGGGAQFGDDYMSLLQWPLYGWRARAEERIWRLLDEYQLSGADIETLDHSDLGVGLRGSGSDHQPLTRIEHSLHRSGKMGATGGRGKDAEWQLEQGNQAFSARNSRSGPGGGGTRRVDSGDSAAFILGGMVGAGELSSTLPRGLSSPTRPFFRPNTAGGREMSERPTSPTSSLAAAHQQGIRSRPASASALGPVLLGGAVGVEAAEFGSSGAKVADKQSPSMAQYGSGSGTFGRSRHTSLTFASDVPPLPEQAEAGSSRDRDAILAAADSSPGPALSSPPIGALVAGGPATAAPFDSPPLLQRPSPALEPMFHDRSAEGLARHVSMAGSTHGLSGGETSASVSGLSASFPPSASASVSASVSALGVAHPSNSSTTTGRLLHPRSTGQLRLNVVTQQRAAALLRAQGPDLRPSSPSTSSSGSHSTIMSEDSEERRLWASFPEQSRKHPPGLIALEMEQRQIEAAEAAVKAAAAAEISRQRLAAERAKSGLLDGDRTPRNGASIDGLPNAAGVGIGGSSRDRERELGLGAGVAGAFDSSLSGGIPISGGSQGAMGPLESLLSISPPDRGLIPIKEESLTSGSIHTASRSHSLSLSHSHSLSRGSVGAQSNAPALDEAEEEEPTRQGHHDIARGR
ncbi:hypothetical protein V8E36_007118 [Tilletia maclaganii]